MGRSETVVRRKTSKPPATTTSTATATNSATNSAVRSATGREGLLGLTYVDERVIEIHVRQGPSTALRIPGERATDFSTDAGDFAECFAVWQTGPANHRARLADAPEDHQLADIVNS